MTVCIDCSQVIVFSLIFLVYGRHPFPVKTGLDTPCRPRPSPEFHHYWTEDVKEMLSIIRSAFNRERYSTTLSYFIQSLHYIVTFVKPNYFSSSSVEGVSLATEALENLRLSTDPTKVSQVYTYIQIVSGFIRSGFKVLMQRPPVFF